MEYVVVVMSDPALIVMICFSLLFFLAGMSVDRMRFRAACISNTRRPACGNAQKVTSRF